MSARILDGNKIRDQIQAELLSQIAELKAAGIRPGLAAVLVGDNPASHIYVRNKVKMCESLGLYCDKIELPNETTEEQLLSASVASVRSTCAAASGVMSGSSSVSTSSCSVT